MHQADDVGLHLYILVTSINKAANARLWNLPKGRIYLKSYRARNATALQMYKNTIAKNRLYR